MAGTEIGQEKGLPVPKQTPEEPRCVDPGLIPVVPKAALEDREPVGLNPARDEADREQLDRREPRKPAMTTVDTPVGERRVAESGADPASSRFIEASRQGNMPAEPHVPLLGTKSARKEHDDHNRFAIIARLLFRNATNQQMLDALKQAGHAISMRTLNRILGRPDFNDYMESYRVMMLGPLDQQLREDFKLAAPEAMTRILQLMRSSRSDKVKFDAAIKILEGSGALRVITENRNVNFNVDETLKRRLRTAGERIVDISTDYQPKYEGNELSEDAPPASDPRADKAS